MTTQHLAEYECSSSTAVDSSSEGMNALIVGRAPTLMWAVPYLLHRAGFSVDVITTSHLLRASRFAGNVGVVQTPEAMIAETYVRVCSREKPYDWVIACDDDTLRKLSELHWPEERRPRYLPLKNSGEVSHIYSKIGLSRVLAGAGVRTPEFRVVCSEAEALAAARELRYPVLLKIDSSNGAAGVFECKDESEVAQAYSRVEGQPCLIQKKIKGQELDLSSIFFSGELVHFAYAEIERMIPGNKLSVLRRYYPLPVVGIEIFSELEALGKALKASGFVSIACIDAADGSGRYYFEADMRPNVWVDASRYLGDDAATRIRAYFTDGAKLSWGRPGSGTQCHPVRIAHFIRVCFWELVVNRYQVWKFIPWAEWRVVLHLLISRAIMPGARTFVPQRIRHLLKDGLITLRIAIP